MKKVLIINFGIYLILASISFANSQYPITDEQRDATTVLEVFLNALIRGDTEAIKESLGGNLLKKRRSLLNNPDYPAFLRNLYGSARFEILRYKSLEKNSIQIDVRIDTNEQESSQFRFLLTKKAMFPDSALQFRIYSQTEITK